METICSIQNITKRFPGTVALNDVSFDIKKGEIHAIVGENGAGKSTLMNVLSGVYPADEGKVEICGKECKFENTNDAKSAGIAMIHQELSLITTMTAAENVYINRMPKNKMGLIDYGKMNVDCKKYLEKLGVSYISPRKKVGNLSVSEQQLLEISKALSLDAKIIIMDEPTSSLTNAEVEFLLNIVLGLKKQGVTILYISHKLEEILRIADTITIMRDGRHIATKSKAELNEHDMVSLMVGRDFNRIHDREFITNYSNMDPILKVENLSDMSGKVTNVSFELYPGEVLGLTGLVGAGRTELLQCIFGANMVKGGKIFFKGKEVKIHSCNDAIKLGIGLIPEGRKIQGLFLKMSVKENMLTVYQKQIAKFGILRTKKLNGIAGEYKTLLSIKTPSLDQSVTSLSGGNQQKTIVARWLMNKPKVLFMDEPSHGIDIGAKTEIYKIIDSLTKEGIAVVLLSSELPEVLSLCDRIMVMHHGYKRGELMNAEANQVKLMSFTLDEAKTDYERVN